MSDRMIVFYFYVTLGDNHYHQLGRKARQPARFVRRGAREVHPGPLLRDALWPTNIIVLRHPFPLALPRRRACTTRATSTTPAVSASSSTSRVVSRTRLSARRCRC